MLKKITRLLQWIPLGSVPEINAEDLARLIESDVPVQILDVRTFTEWQSAHIQNAINIPVFHLARRVKELPFDRQDPVVVICLSAHRSIPAVRLLKRLGYENVKQLKGGMRCWHKLPADIHSALTEQKVVSK